MYQIKRGTAVIWSGKAHGTQYKKIMQEDRVVITIDTPIAINFKKGDTIQVYGETYKLNRPENVTRVNSKIGYSYTIEFEALYYDLGKWTLYTLDKNNKLTQPDVYVMGQASAILGLLVQNANRASSGWTLGTVDVTDEIQWSYNGAKLLTVLQDIADRTNLEFWCIGKQINLTRRQPETGITLEYGKGKGLYEISRERQDKPVVTHMTVLGGTQNVPNNYGFRQIQPTGGNPMVNPNYVAGMDRVEDVLVFENVYPRLNASVTSIVASNIIRSTAIDFNLNDYLLKDGTSAQIAFTSGLLKGFKFTIAKDGYDHATKQITFNIIADDNAYPDGVPNAVLKPVVGDTFVLLNISMPPTYVTAAETRLKELGTQYFAEEGVEQYTWAGKITPKFVLENNITLELGGLITLRATDVGFNGKIRIASYERDLEESYRYNFTLSNIITINALVRQKNATDQLANTVSKGLSSDGLSTKATYAENAGYAALAGHAESATTAATANFASIAEKAYRADRATLADRATNADHADNADFAILADRARLADYALDADHAKEADHALLADKAKVADYAYDSDKWDGRQFTDFLNQAVRTTDSVEFAGVVATALMRIPQVSNAATDALWKSGTYAMFGGAKVWAGRADLWNGLSQPSYINQPVRSTDSPNFEGVSSSTFTSGFSGNGYRLAKDANGDYMLEVDRMIVRKDFSVYELIVNQIRATNGALWVSDAIKIKTVTVSGSNYVCGIDSDGGTIYTPFAVNDIVRCQKFNGRAMKYYVARVTAVTTDTFTITRIEGASNPAPGDEVVRMGNTTNANRQGALYLTASDSGAPFLDVIDGVTSASLAGKTKVRLGKLDGIVDADLGNLSGYGIYAQNGFFKGKFIVQTGSNVYTKSEANTAVSNAKSEAITAAAGDATTKANNAKSEAISTAAADATTKADAARDLAISKANQFATDAVNAVQIGGRNYIPLSAQEWVTPGIASNSAYGVYKTNLNNIFSQLVGKPVVISFDCKLDLVNGATSGNVQVYSANGAPKYKFGSVVMGVTKDWARYQVAIKINDSTDTGAAKIEFYGNAANINITKIYVRNFKMEIGTKATDWTPAPEDMENALEVFKTETASSFQVLDDKIATKVSQSDYNALGQRVSQAESSITQQAGQIATKVSQTAFDSLNNKVTGIDGRVTTAESSLVQQAGLIATKVTQAQVDTSLAAIQIGGRNLLPKSNNLLATTASAGVTYVVNTDGSITITATNTARGYINPLIRWSAGFPVTLTESRFNEGDDFTISFLCKTTDLTTPKPDIHIKTGLGYFATIGTLGTEYSLFYYTGKWKKANTISLHLGVYKGNYTIANLKLEKGNKPTDWSPAPEDLQGQIDSVATRLATAESSITQQADQIALRVTKSELTTAIAGVQTGSVNLLSLIDLQENHYQNAANPNLRSWKFLGNPNTNYTLSVTAPKSGTSYDVFFAVYPSVPSSAAGGNGVAINEPRTVNSGSTGILEISFRSTTLINLFVGGEYNIQLESGTRATEWTPNSNDLFFIMNNILLTRIVSAETSIVQNSNEIFLRATKTEVTTQVNTAKSEAISTAAGDATSKANAAQTNAISSASADATTKANNAVTTSKTYTDSQITIANNAIALKADKSVTDNLGTRLSNAELKITPEAINLTVKAQTEAISQAAVDKVTVGSRNLLRKSNTVFKKEEGDGKYGIGSYTVAAPFSPLAVGKKFTLVVKGSNSGVGTLGVWVNGSQSLKTDLISNQTDVIKTIVFTRNTNANIGTAISFYHYPQGSAGTSQVDWAVLYEGEITTPSMDWVPAPEDSISDIDGLGTRITNAETSISQNTSAIALRATKGEVDAINNRLSSAELKITPEAIQQTVKSQTETIANAAVSNLNLGARNYLSTKGFVFYTAYYSGSLVNGLLIAKRISTATDTLVFTVTGYNNTVFLKGIYTFSGYVKINGAIPAALTSGGRLNTQSGSTVRTTYDPNTGYLEATHNFGGSTAWFLHTNFFLGQVAVGDVITIDKAKFERGDKATDWTPSPDDVQGQIDSAVTRISDAETSITQNANQIALRATKLEVETAVNNVTVGVTNYQRSLLASTTGSNATVSNLTDRTANVKFNKSGSTPYIFLSFLYPYTVGEQHILSFYVKATLETSDTTVPVTYGIRGTTGTGDITKTIPVGSWVKIEQLYTPTTYDPIASRVIIFTRDYSKGVTFEIKDPKFERGNKATAWSPAPEDVQGQIDTVATRITNAETSITQNADQIQLRATKSEVTTAKIEAISTASNDATSKANAAQNAAAADATTKANSARTGAVADAKNYTDGQVGPLATRVSTAETSITQNAEQIALRATKTEVTTTVNTAVSGIQLGGTNLMKNSNSIALFGAYMGASITKTDNIVVAEWGAVDANQIQTTGGTNVLKVLVSVYTPKLGEVITISGWFKNNGSKDIYVYSNQGGRLFTLTPGSATRVVFEGIEGNGIGNVQFQLRTVAAADAMNITWWRLKAENGNKVSDWSPAPEDTQVGGRNLLQNSSFANTAKWTLSAGTTLQIVSDPVYGNVGKISITGSNNTGVTNTSTNNGVLVSGENYTMSGWFKSDVNVNIYIAYEGSGVVNAKLISLTTSWQFFSYTRPYSGNGIVRIYGPTGAVVYATNLKVEKGTIATDWSPAPEDVQGEIQEVITRIVNAETSISQNSNQIALRATKTEVTTAKNEAITAAAGDATAKANTAQQNATSTAAADATTKANNAQANAISTAATDATTKANNAKSAAISAAATDATNKANSAEANAVSSSKTYTDSQITIANNAISLKADKTVTDTLATRINNAEAKITPDAINFVVKSQVQATRQGKMLFRDPTFLSGNNGLVVYDNANSGTVTITRENVTGGSQPTGTGYRLKVVTNGAGSNPNWGGVRWGFSGTTNGVYNIRLNALIPIGRSIMWGTNSLGTGGSATWLTGTEGTGAFTDYIMQVRFGTGSISTTGFFSIAGGAAPTAASPLTWYLSYASVFDLTNVDDTPTTDEIKAGISVKAGAISIFGQDISLAGKVTFGSLETSAQNTINTASSNASNAVTTANTANSNASTALSTANNAKNELATLQASLKGMAFEDKVEVAKLGTTIINGGYLKTELLNVTEIFSKNITATGQIIATNLLVTGSSQVAGFRISGNRLENNAVDAALIFDQLGGDGFLRINGDAGSILSIRTDTASRRGISISTYAAGAIGLDIINNASSGSGLAVKAVGSSQFYIRSGETWNAPGVLGAALVDLSNAATSHFWSIAGLGSYFYKANSLTLRWNHNLGHTDYVIIATLVNPNVANIVAPQKYDDYMTITYNLIQPGASPLLNLMLIGRNKLT